MDLVFLNREALREAGAGNANHGLGARWGRRCLASVPSRMPRSALAGGGPNATLVVPSAPATMTTRPAPLQQTFRLCWIVSHDRAFHRRRTRCTRPHRPCAAGDIPGAVGRLLLYAGSLRPCKELSHPLSGQRARHRHRLDDARRNRRRICPGSRRGRGRRPASFGRPVGLERHGRAIAKIGCAWDSLYHYARRSACGSYAAALGRELTLPECRATGSAGREHRAGHRRCRPARSSRHSPRPVRRLPSISRSDPCPRIHRGGISPALWSGICPVAIVYRATWPDEQIKFAAPSGR